MINNHIISLTRGRSGRMSKRGLALPAAAILVAAVAAAGSRISLPRWRDPSVGCRHETSAVAGSVSVTQLRTRYGWLATVSRPGQGSCRLGTGAMPLPGCGR